MDIDAIALKAASTGSILADPDACLVMMIALPLGFTPAPSRLHAANHDRLCEDFGFQREERTCIGLALISESDPKRTSDLARFVVIHTATSAGFISRNAQHLPTLAARRSNTGGTFGVHVLKCQYFVACDQCFLRVMGTFPCQDNDRRTVMRRVVRETKLRTQGRVRLLVVLI